MRCNLTTDPRVVEIASILGIDEFATVGRLHAVWAWLDQHSLDGTNVRIASAFLGRLTACQGFADAMRAVGWLAGRDGALEFPGYTKHNGPTAKARASETKRKEAQRARDRDQDKPRDERPHDNVTNVPAQAGLEKRREEKNTERESGRAAPRALGQMAKETEQAWLERMVATHPGLDVPAQLELARRHRAKEGKPLERAWFEFAWLRNASEEVAGTAKPQAEIEPAGWQEVVRARWPQAQAKAWRELPRDVKREVIEALGGSAA